MGTLRPDPRNSLLRVSRYLNVRLSLFAFFTSTTMSPLPNLRECNDNELAELLSDSEDLLAAKYEEQMRQRWEACKRRKCEECE